MNWSALLRYKIYIEAVRKDALWNHVIIDTDIRCRVGHVGRSVHALCRLIHYDVMKAGGSHSSPCVSTCPIKTAESSCAVSELSSCHL